MNNKNQFFEAQKFWYYNQIRQTGIMVSINQREKGTFISICDNSGKIELALQDVPVLIGMLERLLH